MALDELFDTFEFLKQRIEEHRDYLSQDETRTRQVLIDPLLKELGWDVGDPSVVELEHKMEKPFGGKGNFKPDYALMQDGQPAAVVEAKRLDSRMLDDATEQVHTYAYNEVIPYGVATDGDEWRLIDVQKLVKPMDKVTTLFRVSTDDACKCALMSLALWRPNICAEGGPVAALSPVLAESPSTIPMPANLATAITESPVTAPDIVAPSGQGAWFPIVGELPKGLPLSVRFGEATPSEWVSWKQFYSDVATYVVSSGNIRASDSPVSVTKGKNCVMNDVPEHPDGRRFKAPVQLSGGLWLETNLNTNQIRELSRRLLMKFHSDPESVQVRFD